MLILIANVEMRSLTGTVIVVRDLALGLQRRGHKVVVYAPVLGEPAQDLLRQGISIVDRLDRWGQVPDVIHGHHNLPTVLALTRFPTVPAVWVKHGRGDWFDSPPRFTRIYRYLAVDTLRRDMLTERYGIPPDDVEILPNAVDLRLYAPRAEPLPRVPRNLLLFSKTTGVLEHVNRSNETLGLRVQAIGIGVRRPTKTPERYLGAADIVVATGRMAIEAICAGAAVVVADVRGVAGMVTSENYQAFQRVNFGATSLVAKITGALLRAEIRKYNARDARRVAERMRGDADLEKAIDRLEHLYREAIEANHGRGWTTEDSKSVQLTLDTWPAEATSLAAWRAVRDQLGAFLVKNDASIA